MSNPRRALPEDDAPDPSDTAAWRAYYCPAVVPLPGNHRRARRARLPWWRRWLSFA